MGYRYETNCVNSDACSINDMVERARRISSRTFRSELGQVLYHWLETLLGYERCAVRLDRDYAVTFHRSTYRGKPCVYVEHSRIEYIFTEK